jgi:spore coat protein A
MVQNKIETFGGWKEDADGNFQLPPADPNTTGQVMTFIVDTKLNKPYGDRSMPAEELNLNPWSLGKDDKTKYKPKSRFRLGGAATNVRRVALHEEISSTTELRDDYATFEGPVSALLGIPEPRLWVHPIDVVPVYNSIKVWEIENEMEDAHPIHLHQVEFQVIDRLPMEREKTTTTVAPSKRDGKRQSSLTLVR